MQIEAEKLSENLQPEWKRASKISLISDNERTLKGDSTLRSFRGGTNSSTMDSKITIMSILNDNLIERVKFVLLSTKKKEDFLCILQKLLKIKL